ncbi:MAG: hypothetical protein KY451_01875 [Actinobacteria bacterium]|nr:hypothetical protein [Actinomycetota bacterium]
MGPGRRKGTGCSWQHLAFDQGLLGPWTQGNAETGLGLFDQRGSHYGTLARTNGFRGIYGEERSEFFVAATAASQSFQPGPVEPGEWTVIVPVFSAETRPVHDCRHLVPGTAGAGPSPLRARVPKREPSSDVDLFVAARARAAPSSASPRNSAESSMGTSA